MATKRKMICPECKRRAFDIAGLPRNKKTQIEVELKCPHCSKLVKIPCSTGIRVEAEA